MFNCVCVMPSNHRKPWLSLSGCAVSPCSRKAWVQIQMTHAPSSELEPGLSTHTLTLPHSKELTQTQGDICPKMCAQTNTSAHTQTQPVVCVCVCIFSNLICTELSGTLSHKPGKFGSSQIRSDVFQTILYDCFIYFFYALHICWHMRKKHSK